MKYFLTAAIACFLLATTARAQESVATVFGHVHLASPDDAQNLLFGMQEVTSQAMVEAEAPDTNGDFEFPDLPFATYDLYLREQNHSVFVRRIVLASIAPVHIELDSVPGVENAAEAPNWNTPSPETHTLFQPPTISTLPVANTAYGIEALQLQSPGIVPSENGWMHLRGESLAPQYVIDGIPITTQETRTTMPLFDASLIQSADLLRGSLDPHYGSNGILNITTKSGFDATTFGHAEYSIGTLGNSSQEVDLGGRGGNLLAYYASYGNFSTDRYLDPISGPDPNHTSGSGSDYFGKFEVLPSDAVRITALGYYGSTNYQIPNVSMATMQDQNNSLIATMFGGRIDYDLSSTSVVTALGYTRRQSMSYSSNGANGIGDSISRAAALMSNPLFIGARREDFESGGQLAYSINTESSGIQNNFNVAAEIEIFPLQEYLTFAVTNPSFSDSANGDPRLARYDTTHPFLVDTSATGKRYSAYVEDRLTMNNWTISGGVRYDLYELLGNQSGLSPRVNLAYRASDGLTLRASYNHIFQQAPLENILVSGSSQAAQLMGMSQNSIKAEQSNNFELGMNYSIDKYLSFDLSGYYKTVDNMLALFDLGNSGILLPANIKNGKIYGGEFELRLSDWNHFYSTLTVSSVSALGTAPGDGSSPYTAGLAVGGLAQSYATESIGQSSFRTVASEPLAASLLVRYQPSNEYFFAVSGRYDRGLPFGYMLPPPAVGTGATAPVSSTYAFQNLLDLNTTSPEQSVAAHTTFDFSAGVNLSRFGLPLMISGSVINIFNAQYLTQFDPVEGGAHFGASRTFLIEGELSP